MTVAAGIDTRVSYIADGTQTDFTIPFAFLDDCLITVDGLSQSFVTTPDNLSFVVSPAPASGAEVVIERSTRISQDLLLSKTSPFPAEQVMAALDKQIFIDQELANRLGRIEAVYPLNDLSNAILIGDAAGDQLIAYDLGDAATRGGKVLGFAAGTGEPSLFIPEASGVLQSELDLRLLAVDDITAYNGGALRLYSGKGLWVSDGTTGHNAGEADGALSLLSAAGRIYVLESGEIGSVTLAVPAFYPTIEEAHKALDGVDIETGATVTIEITGIIDEPNILSRPGRAQVVLKGADFKADTDIVSIDSVTGSAGAWTVTATLASGANIAVGDYVRVRDVVPGLPKPGVITGRPAPGEVTMPFFKIGSITGAKGGTAITTSNAVNPTYMQVGDLLFSGGDVMSLAAVAAGALTTNEALRRTFSSQQYMNIAAGFAGTVSVAGNAVTGTGTAFLTSCNPGDVFIAAGGGMAIIDAIASDTAMTLRKAMPTLTNVAYSVKIPGEAHQGVFPVTAVNGNQVSWTNFDRFSFYPLPVNGITGGSVKAYGGGIRRAGTVLGSYGGAWRAEQLAIISTSGQAVDFRVTVGAIETDLKIDEQSVIYCPTGFAAHIEDGGNITANKATLVGSTRVDKGDINLADAVIHGAPNYGLSIINGGTRCAGAQFVGCLIGIRQDVGGSDWGDFVRVTRTATRGLQCVGGSLVHNVGAEVWLANQPVYQENGGDGRYSGALIVGSISIPFSVFGGDIEATQVQVYAGEIGAIRCYGGMIKFNDSGFIAAHDSSIAAIDARQAADLYGSGVMVGGNILIFAERSDVDIATLHKATNADATDVEVGVGGRISISGTNGLTGSEPPHSVHPDGRYIALDDGGNIKISNAELENPLIEFTQANAPTRTRTKIEIIEFTHDFASLADGASIDLIVNAAKAPLAANVVLGRSYFLVAMVRDLPEGVNVIVPSGETTNGIFKLRLSNNSGAAYDMPSTTFRVMHILVEDVS